MRQPDVHTLAGAYALDALPDQETALFEEHLAACAACREEVAGLRAAAAKLGESSAAPAPAAMRARVLAGISVTRQAPSLGTNADDRGARWRRLRRYVAPIAAAAVLVAVVLGGLALDARLDALEVRSAQVVAVLAADDTQGVVLHGEQHRPARIIMSPSEGQAVFVANELPLPGQGRTYQLWLIGQHGPRSAGVFRPGDHGEVVQAMSGEMSDVQAVAVTIEPVGGSLQPTSDAVLYGRT
jgi:anti-sigma-K factor RskA